ncbi:FecCD family ABC transporter permease [Chitinimonas taiwanensis]|uniref:Iron complex transport system permease protein n=1 Tax=Chitinimonas taiwanensis DSM 18899 TaxID=1121279 RepID=A0A1K2HMV1_9NEIS|nr:iron ABC transporter permease [Chitinimonas taiwanensis]SFZ78132.1 iron complex transport system permease protein [Chitinimonas taiwanensis DSM 18899]
MPTSEARLRWPHRPPVFAPLLAGLYGLLPRLALLAASAGLIVFALGFAGDGWQWPDLADPLVSALRLPRVLSALLVGAALAAAGAALQALFRNPLADPGLIGTASGAALAVVAVMALGLVSIGLPTAAFIGALLSTWLLLGLSRLLGGGEISLLLLGLVLGSLAAAATGMLLFLSDDLTLRSAMSWLSGQLGSSTGAPLAWAAPFALAGIALLLAMGRELDCLLLGEDEARSLGVPVERVRLWTAIGAALAVGAAVSVAGIIGFIGMMVPNACALLLGGGRRRLIWVSSLAGALFLLLMDTLARGIAYPVNLPVGLLAGFIGPLCFFWLFRLRARRLA